MYLFDPTTARQSLWESRLREALRKAGLESAYIEDRQRWQNVDRAREARDDLREWVQGFDNPLRAEHAPGGCQFLGRIEEQVKQCRLKLRALQTEYLRMRDSAERSQFVIPHGIEDEVRRKVSEKVAGICFRPPRAVLERRASAIWASLFASERQWVDACEDGLAAVLGRQKALAMDWLLRTPMRMNEVLSKLPFACDPVDHLSSRIKDGYLVGCGVPRNSRVRAAIKRAQDCERRLLRYYLETAGPASPWTLRFARIHHSQGAADKKCLRQCAEISTTLRAKLAAHFKGGACQEDHPALR
jgi:hypothetical protein